MPSFIETQFPITRLSAESYKERKAKNGQTLTQLKHSQVATYLGLGELANFDLRLCRWIANKAHEQGSDVFANQALNTNFSYSIRPLSKWDSAWVLALNLTLTSFHKNVTVVADARDLRETCDLWLTASPPTPMPSTTTNSATSSWLGTTSNSARLSPNGRPTRAPNWQYAVTAKISAVPWWTPTKIWPATCPTTACKW